LVSLGIVGPLAHPRFDLDHFPTRRADGGELRWAAGAAEAVVELGLSQSNRRESRQVAYTRAILQNPFGEQRDAVDHRAARAAGLIRRSSIAGESIRPPRFL
jgi:hypothetical protein